jgi:hypothetical protein
MRVSGPPASGQRIAWEALPDHVRAAVEGWLGSAVVSATTQPGGFSPGVASRLVAADVTPLPPPRDPDRRRAA